MVRWMTVVDQATAASMTAFYRNRQAGKSRAAALQAARAEVRAKPRWASPFYWAGFVLNGDPGNAGSSLLPTVSASATPTSVSAEGKGGEICGALGAIVPLAMLGGWGARRRERMR